MIFKTNIQTRKSIDPDPNQPKQLVWRWFSYIRITYFHLTQAVSNLQKLLVVIVRRQPGGVLGPDVKQSSGTVRIVKKNVFRVSSQPQLISEQPFKTCLVLNLSNVPYC